MADVIKRTVRFCISGNWTRWYSDAEVADLDHMKGWEIQAMEVSETMPREKAMEYLKSLEAVMP